MFKIKFLEGTDTIKIGMTSQEIQKLVGEIPEKTTKEGVKNPVDMYSVCFIYFDDDGKCEGIEGKVESIYVGREGCYLELGI